VATVRKKLDIMWSCARRNPGGGLEQKTFREKELGDRWIHGIVPVTFCQDCVDWVADTSVVDGKIFHVCRRTDCFHVMEADDFCSYGRRKPEAEPEGGEP
jgi:hypothetical protein